MAARSSTSARDGLGLEGGEALEPALVAEGHAHVVAALDELPHHVAADETGPAGDANLHARAPKLPICR